MKQKKETRFEFGANWHDFVDRHFSDERVDLAASSLKQILRVDTLSGMSFLDIGCGSGLFSLAALKLGASTVVSVDYDPNSVKTTTMLRSKAGVNSDIWKIYHGSVLDPEFMKGLGAFDVVYSWGVLHHTGKMWNAIDTAIQAILPGGLFGISIYNKVDRIGVGSKTWGSIKKFYVNAPPFIKKIIEFLYISNYIVRHLITLRNPFKQIENYRFQRSRGMSFFHDVRDWVGGYPYEYATAGEIFNYIHYKHGLRLHYLTSTHSLGCNQFLFMKPQSKSAL